MMFEKLFEVGSCGYKIVVKTTPTDDGVFDIKLSAEKQGEIVAVDYVFKVTEANKNQKQSANQRIEADGLIGLLVAYADSLKAKDLDHGVSGQLELSDDHHDLAQSEIPFEP